MQTLKLYTEDAGDGYTNVVVEGSPDAFQWLIAAAGNARDGFNNNQADATDGEHGPRRLVLVPENPQAPRDQLPKRRTAHLAVDNPAAKASAHIPIDQEAYAAIGDEIRAELHRRGIRWAVKEEEPATADTAPPAGQHFPTSSPDVVAAGPPPAGAVGPDGGNNTPPAPQEATS